MRQRNFNYEYFMRIIVRLCVSIIRLRIGWMVKRRGDGMDSARRLGINSIAIQRSNCYERMNETVYNRLFGNIVGEQISETCSLVSAKRHPWKTAPPFPPFLFLPVVSHGRDAADSIPPMRYFRIVGYRRLHLRNTRWTRISVKAIGLKHRWRITNESRFEVLVVKANRRCGILHSAVHSRKIDN